MQEVLEQFGTDEIERETPSGAEARLYSPEDANNWLKRRGSDLADLLVDNAGKAKLISIGGEGQGQFAISPESKSVADGDSGQITAALDSQGYIPLTENARNQLCKLMGVSRGFDRYKKMHAPEKRYISDFKGQWSGEEGEKNPLIFRTSSIGGQRRVEGIIPQKADRTDENQMVRIAMREVMKKVGNGLRGVEFVYDPERATRSFRLVFGDANFDHDDPNGSAHIINMRDRIYPMMDMRLSASGVVTPQVTLGIWRMLCRNTAMDELLPAARWSGGSDKSLEQFEKSMTAMAALAVPFGNLLGQRCDELYDAPLNVTPSACIEKMMDLGAISSSHGEQALTLYENGYGDGIHNGEGQFGMFNALTDSAKSLNPIQSRRSAEARSLTLAMQVDGFNGVCRHGLNVRKSRADMVALCDTNPEIKDVLAKAAANN